MATGIRPIGEHLREWRTRRRLSQLDLALEANISARHLSFLETGRARPSREMLLHLAERLEVPLRDRNLLLLAAGFAPAYPQRTLDDPALVAARGAIDLLLKRHEPYPALAVDRHWTLVAANSAVGLLLDGIPEAMLRPPLNVLRLSLHPDGLAPRIINFEEWRGHILQRLHHQHRTTGDQVLAEMLTELGGYPAPSATEPVDRSMTTDPILVPLRLRSPRGELSFISTTTVFGTPLDITLAEIALETFFPADDATAAALREHAEHGMAPPKPHGRRGRSTDGC